MIAFINRFTVISGQQQKALQLIQRIYSKLIRHQVGFVRAELLVSDDGTKVIAIALWESEVNFREMLRLQEFREYHDENFYNVIQSSDAHVYKKAVVIESSNN